MKRWLYAYDVVRGPWPALVATLRRDLPALFTRATGEQPAPPAADGSFTARLPAELGGLRAAKAVRVRIGAAGRATDRLRVPVSWAPEPARYAFPSFEGALELSVLSATHAQLTLSGASLLPLGPVGAAAEALALRGVADDTARMLVERLASALEAAVAAPDEEPPTVPTPGVLLRVEDVMTPDPVAFDEAMPLRTAARVLVEMGVHGAPVIDADGALVGVVSERDLLDKETGAPLGLGRRAREARRRHEALTVGEACTRPARVTHPAATLHEATGIMVAHDVARLVVLEGAEVVGLVTRHDVLRGLLRGDAELEGAAAALLAELGQQEVRARVTAGVAALSGRLRRRSERDLVLRRVADVDGVLSVDDEELSWAEDDVAPRGT